MCECLNGTGMGMEKNLGGLSVFTCTFMGILRSRE